ncbi:MAG: hypothetical protein HYX73_00435 [Acidobacteria bacterium]|nr:hypothetical protein [Acidobacteriota bacterium]
MDHITRYLPSLLIVGFRNPRGSEKGRKILPVIIAGFFSTKLHLVHGALAQNQADLTRKLDLLKAYPDLTYGRTRLPLQLWGTLEFEIWDGAGLVLGRWLVIG